MKVIFTTFLASLVAISSSCDSDRQAKAAEAQAQVKLRVAKQMRDLNDQEHQAMIRGVRTTQGEDAASRLEQCYADGYDSVQNDDHTFKSAGGLGPQYIARCDRIAGTYRRWADAMDRQHKAEISK